MGMHDLEQARMHAHTSVFTFSLWHISQSGDNDLFDTGMMRQATPEEGSKTPPQSLQRSSQSIGIMHVAMCISVAHSDIQCVCTYLHTSYGTSNHVSVGCANIL